LHFPVPLSADGVSIADDWDTMGMRASGSNTIIMERVFIPEESVALRRPRGVYHPAYNVILGVAMPLVMSAYLGVAEAAFALAKQQAAKKASDPVVHMGLGQLTNRLTTAQLAVENMVGLVDEWQFEATNEFVDKILVRKTIAAKAVLAVGETAFETFGGAGFHRKFGLERLLRDLHAGQFHPLPERRQHLFTGRIALGLEPIEIKPEVALDQAAE
jgi:acyl-CoA dehydrogenase